MNILFDIDILLDRRVWENWNCRQSCGNRWGWNICIFLFFETAIMHHFSVFWLDFAWQIIIGDPTSCIYFPRGYFKKQLICCTSMWMNRSVSECSISCSLMMTDSLTLSHRIVTALPITCSQNCTYCCHLIGFISFHAPQDLLHSKFRCLMPVPYRHSLLSLGDPEV